MQKPDTRYLEKSWCAYHLSVVSNATHLTFIVSPSRQLLCEYGMSLE